MHSFKKSERLKSKKQIDLLFVRGKIIYEFPVKTVWLTSELEMGNPVQVGFAVSKRHYKKAVDRNRLKRIMREAYRLNKSQLTKKVEDLNIHLAVMLIYTGNNLTSFKEVEDKIIVILNRLVIELNGS